MFRFSILLGLALLLSSSLMATPFWQPLKDTVLKVDLETKGRKEKIRLTKQVIQMATDCIRQNPGEAACYYYRAQATGLYYEVVIFGYQKGVRSMIQDWQKAVALDPTLDHGGPYRMLGELYTALPRYWGTKDLRQDLAKALDYLQKAIEIEPNYPTNHLDLAEALLKSQKKEEAKLSLQTAQSLIPEWTSDPYFSSWQQRITELAKQLKGVIYGKSQ